MTKCRVDCACSFHNTHPLISYTDIPLSYPLLCLMMISNLHCSWRVVTALQALNKVSTWSYGTEQLVSDLLRVPADAVWIVTVKGCGLHRFFGGLPKKKESVLHWNRSAWGPWCGQKKELSLIVNNSGHDHQRLSWLWGVTGVRDSKWSWDHFDQINKRDSVSGTGTSEIISVNTKLVSLSQ